MSSHTRPPNASHSPTKRLLPCRFAADLVHETRKGYSDIERHFCSSSGDNGDEKGKVECASTLRDALVRYSGQHAFDLAFIITFDNNDKFDDARMNFLLIPAFLVCVQSIVAFLHVALTRPRTAVPPYLFYFRSPMIATTKRLVPCFITLRNTCIQMSLISARS